MQYNINQHKILRSGPVPTVIYTYIFRITSLRLVLTMMMSRSETQFVDTCYELMGETVFDASESLQFSKFNSCVLLQPLLHKQTVRPSPPGISHTQVTKQVSQSNSCPKWTGTVAIEIGNNFGTLTSGTRPVKIAVIHGRMNSTYRDPIQRHLRTCVYQYT